jgi:hypothetical protein
MFFGGELQVFKPIPVGDIIIGGDHRCKMTLLGKTRFGRDSIRPGF